MANTIEVTGCGDCPMAFRYISGDVHCDHPEIEGDDNVRLGTKILPNCPLKQSSITITLKTKN